jgi:hypothetical protein
MHEAAGVLPGFGTLRGRPSVNDHKPSPHPTELSPGTNINFRQSLGSLMPALSLPSYNRAHENDVPAMGRTRCGRPGRGDRVGRMRRLPRSAPGRGLDRPPGRPAAREARPGQAGRVLAGYAGQRHPGLPGPEQWRPHPPCAGWERPEPGRLDLQEHVRAVRPKDRGALLWQRHPAAIVRRVP